MSEVSFLEAIRFAIQDEMQNDKNVILIGEDIGVYGGAFKLTEGLIKEFGSERVIDTPIAEAAVVGAAAGAAMCGLKPVAELQFIDFISCGGFDQIINVAAKSRYRNGVACPIVVRGPAGAGGRGGPFHSTCPEMWFVASPGIKVVFPSTIQDGYDLMRTAIQDPDPVLFLEHKFLYRRVKGSLQRHKAPAPIGKAEVRHPGTDLSILTYGAMTLHAIEVAKSFAAENISVRVIDLRTLSPLDKNVIRQAVMETNRILIVHEHPQEGGIAGEISAIVNEDVFEYLDAPIMRLSPPNIPVPYAPSLEDAYLPGPQQLKAKAEALLAY